MNILGVSFILYVLKLSSGTGFYYFILWWHSTKYKTQIDIDADVNAASDEEHLIYGGT